MLQLSGAGNQVPAAFLAAQTSRCSLAFNSWIYKTTKGQFDNKRLKN